MKIIIAGGTGYLGKVLIRQFKNDEIVILSRAESHVKNGIKYVQWDAQNLGQWKHELEGADALINLVGKSVDCRYTEKNKSLILNSRLDATRVLGMALLETKNPPEIWLNAASATIYRHSLDKAMEESSFEFGEGFSVDVCQQWEKEFFRFLLPNIRKVAMRITIVLGKDGGAIIPLLKLAKFGLGGKQGKGNQMFSWIHQDDFARAIDFVIHHHHIHGPVNMAAPNPLTNRDLMRAIRKAIHRPFGMPLTTCMLKFGARIIKTETELILKSRYVIPGVLTTNDFEFKYGSIDKALDEIVS